MRYLIVIMFLALPLTAKASPFLVCDPQPGQGVEWYEVSGLPNGIGAHVPVDSTGQYGFKLDLRDLPVGSYTVTARACVGLWGCSADSLPFAFERPQAPGTTQGLKLTK